ncbi:MAG: hypothetical protein HY801_12670 [Candidatus Lindowbacteria bacterium]|nr:hypothetical protein [Candidatus Lindowbacteria bacterium]
MILILDNYDSFTYNLVQYVGMSRPDFVVYRNDKITIDEISALNPDRVIISPGPCTPLEAGISIVKKDTLPDCLEITAYTKEDEIMSLKHKQFPIYGVQFHPESILTREGLKIINNFLRIKSPR